MHVKENHLLKNFRVAGINYKKNDTGSRGSFAITGEQYDYLLQMCEQHNIPEFFIISTCNRTEIYGHSSSMTALVDFLFLVCQGDKTLFNEEERR
jgi:glutamyl-tRNA reductase